MEKKCLGLSCVNANVYSNEYRLLSRITYQGRRILWIAKLNATRRRHKKGASWFVAGYINSVQTNNQVMNQGTQTHSTSIGSKGKHITFSERQLIERWVREKKSTAQIASLLARHRVTIQGREREALSLVRGVWGC